MLQLTRAVDVPHGAAKLCCILLSFIYSSH